jgi:hypothetical protein
MNRKHSFTAVIQDASGGGAYVEIPFDVEAAFGSKRPRVKAVIQGVPYRGTLARRGGPKHILIVLKDIRNRIGKSAGDRIRVRVEPDAEPRRVEVPRDLARELKGDPRAAAAFEKLSYTHRREYVQWIEEAGKEDTRRRRILKAIGMLRQGRRAR